MSATASTLAATTVTLGYVEYLSKMEFLAAGFGVYTAEVNDKGIDLVVRIARRKFLEIQVKSLRPATSYVFMRKSKLPIRDHLYPALVAFQATGSPAHYLIPSTTWLRPRQPFVDRGYEGRASAPEYGQNCNPKNMPALQPFQFGLQVEEIKKTVAAQS